MTDPEKIKVCMIVPQPDVKGGIAAVVNHYYGSRLEQDADITYVESYCDGSRWKKLGKALRAYRSFRKILRENPPDLVHIHSSFGPSFYRKMPFIQMCHRRGIPVVNHIHGSAFDEFYGKAPEWKRRLVRKIYGKCARIIVLTDAWKEKIGEIVPKERIRVIPNYSIAHEEVLDAGVVEERFRRQQVLFLGVITEGKGLHEMPAVIEKTAARFPNVRFIFCGVGDDAYIREHLPQPLQKNAAFPGWVRGEEKERYLRESMVFWLPSHMEAMPMSALDAMGYALPVVSCNVGGIPGVVENGRNGVLTAVGDTDGMAAAICAYLGSRSRWEKDARESLRIVEKKFSLERHIDAIEAVYREVLAGIPDAEKERPE